MKAFEHILVPTDFEAASDEAMAIAGAMARTFEARITLLHVWELPIYPHMDFMLNSTLIEQVEEAAVRHLDEALERLRRLCPHADSRLKTGPAWQTIVDFIDDAKPDLVVMGTHGRRGISHAVLGSVAEKVMRLSRVPVLTVHASRG